MTILHSFGESLRVALSAIPLPAVRVLFVLTLLVLLIWVVRLPRTAGRSDPNSGWSADLRLWAAIALMIQLAIYSFV